jgi:hypothetical protein
VIEIDEDGGVYFVRVGPFRSRALAERLERALEAMDAEARLNAGQPLPAADVMGAVNHGLDTLQKSAGHHVVRLDGAPGKPVTVETSSGGKWRTAEPARPTATAEPAVQTSAKDSGGA